MKNTNLHAQRWWYSIIAAVLMVGFLLVLTTSTLNLVLQEMQDGKGRQDYIKAYAGAEGALELALFKMKQSGYWYDDDTFQNSEILGVGNKIPKLSYEFESKVTSYSWSLAAYESDIIPLFWLDASWSGSVSSITLDSEPNIVWNIIAQDSGVSGLWNFSEWSFVWEKTYNEGLGELQYNSNVTIWSVLSGEDYLILYNPSSSDIDYLLSSSDGFTLPRATISSSAQVWKYTQNLETLVDNTKFLGILKYSIYSWN